MVALTYLLSLLFLKLMKLQHQFLGLLLIWKFRVESPKYY